MRVIVWPEYDSSTFFRNKALKLTLLAHNLPGLVSSLITVEMGYKGIVPRGIGNLMVSSTHQGRPLLQVTGANSACCRCYRRLVQTAVALSRRFFLWAI